MYKVIYLSRQGQGCVGGVENLTLREALTECRNVFWAYNVAILREDNTEVLRWEE